MQEPPDNQPQIGGSGEVVSLHDVISSLQPHQRPKLGKGPSIVPFHSEHTYSRPVTLELRSTPLDGANTFPMHPVPEPSTLQEQESDSAVNSAPGPSLTQPPLTLANVGSLGPAPLVETNRFEPRHPVPEHSNTQDPDSPVNSAPGPSVTQPPRNIEGQIENEGVPLHQIISRLQVWPLTQFFSVSFL